MFKARDSVNKKITIGDLMVMLMLGGLDARNVDNKFMGERRAISTIEPIKGDTVFIADSVSRIDA
jgi:hypothetical protein